MSESDVKTPHPLAQLNSSNHNASNVLQRAQELIRALDAESNLHMEQISAEDKGSEPEDSSL